MPTLSATSLPTTLPSLPLTRKFLAAEERLQSAVTTATQWLKVWNLLVNESKTTVVHFHHTNRPPPRPPSIPLNDTNLTVALRHRHLGLLIQQNLCWNSHVDYIMTRATRKMFLLLRLCNSQKHFCSLLLLSNLRPPNSCFCLHCPLTPPRNPQRPA